MVFGTTTARTSGQIRRRARFVRFWDFPITATGSLVTLRMGHISTPLLLVTPRSVARQFNSIVELHSSIKKRIRIFTYFIKFNVFIHIILLKM